MIKKLIFILLFPLSVFAQKEGNIWYFGYNAGIDFNSGSPVALTNSAMYTWEGCASISDLDGNILFYTNGIKVWNANHETMVNGFGLQGHDSSTQSAVIVKKPGPNLIYLIFTVDAFGYENGFMYTEVDMALDGGLGAVNENKNIAVVTPTAEKIIAIQHENMMDHWIVVHKTNSDEFHSYLLNDSGLETTPVISNIGPATTSGFGAIGYMRASFDGNRIAMADPGETGIYDFDNATGELSNHILIIRGSYGLEFSHDANLLYASAEGGDGDIYQYDLLAGTNEEIADSETLIGSGIGYGGAIQMGPDERIYHAGWNSEYLGVIENPNSVGIECNYSTEGFFMDGKVTGIGLPNFKNSILNEAAFSYDYLCLGDSTEFYLHNTDVDSVLWDFGDVDSGLSNNSKNLNPNHYYSESGFYEVSLISYLEDTFNDTIMYWLYIKELPVVALGNDTTICEGQIIGLDATLTNAIYLWQDYSTEATFNITKPGSYWVEVEQNHCISSDTLIAEACNANIEMPNVFSPNGDGTNDYFSPIVYKEVSKSKISIYNRWGKLVYESSSILIAWDGRSQGVESPAGTYYYIIYYKNAVGIEFADKGYVTLVR